EDGSVTSGLLDVTVRPWRVAITSAASCGRPAACRPPVPGTGRSVATRGGDVLVVADNLLDDEAQELLRKDRVETCLLRERPKPCVLTTLTLRIGARRAEIGLDVPHLLGAPEPLGEHVDERGVDVVDRAPRGTQLVRDPRGLVAAVGTEARHAHHDGRQHRVASETPVRRAEPAQGSGGVACGARGVRSAGQAP